MHADVMVRAINRALELRKEVLGLVRAHVAADVLACLVIDELVTGELARDPGVAE
jgi:hypothetical protein